MALLKMIPGLLESLDGIPSPEVMTPAQVVIVRLGDRRVASGIGVDVRTRDAQTRRDLAGNGLRNVALKRQQVHRVALVLFGPELTLALGVDQLHGNADAAAGPPQASREQVAHAQVGTNLVGSFGGLLELHRRLPGDDSQT